MKKEYYTTSLQHILAELERIDLLIQIQVQRARQVQESNCEFQGLCISEQEIDALLKQPIGLPRWASALSPSSRTEIRTALDQMTADIGKRKAESAMHGVFLRVEEFARLFRLTPFDIDVLLICLAPELDLRYECPYAYFQDVVTKKRPSMYLVLNLLCPTFEDKLAARNCFSSESPLLKHYLLHVFDDPSHQKPPLLSKYLKVDERVVNYLLGSDDLDTCLLPHARHSVLRDRLGRNGVTIGSNLRLTFSQSQDRLQVFNLLPQLPVLSWRSLQRREWEWGGPESAGINRHSADHGRVFILNR